MFYLVTVLFIGKETVFWFTAVRDQGIVHSDPGRISVGFD
jgi:hypothetical protein